MYNFTRRINYLYSMQQLHWSVILVSQQQLKKFVQGLQVYQCSLWAHTLLWEQNMTFSQFWPKTSYYGIVVSYKVTSLSMVRWSNSFTAWQLFWPYSLIRYRLLNKLLWIVFVRSLNHNQEINTSWIAPSLYIINTSWIAPSLYKKPMSNMCEELKVWHNST